MLVVLTSGASEQVGKERSQGFELDLRYQLSSSFQGIFGYTYTDAKVVEDLDPLRVGAQLINSARHSWNAWVRYDLSSGVMRGLGFGVGLIWRGLPAGVLPEPGRADGRARPRAAGGRSAVVDLPQYFRTDLNLYYVKSRYEVTLKVTNLFDELYYESAFNLLQVRPGRPERPSSPCACGSRAWAECAAGSHRRRGWVSSPSPRSSSRCRRSRHSESRPQKPSGRVALVVSYRCRPDSRPAFRQHLVSSGLTSLRAWEAAGAFVEHLLLFNVDVNEDAWDALLVLRFEDWGSTDGGRGSSAALPPPSPSTACGSSRACPPP